MSKNKQSHSIKSTLKSQIHKHGGLQSLSNWRIIVRILENLPFYHPNISDEELIQACKYLNKIKPKSI